MLRQKGAHNKMGCISMGREPVSQVSNFFDGIKKKQDQEELLKQRLIEDAIADSKAVWMVADYFVPADVEEFFERHKIGVAGCEIWRSAFISGFRAAMRNKIKDNSKS